MFINLENYSVCASENDFVYNPENGAGWLSVRLVLGCH